MTIVLAPADLDQNQSQAELRPDPQGPITFYHCLSSSGYWFTAGELEAMIDNRLFIELPEAKEELALEEEFARGPVRCPRCGAESKLFEMRSYLSSEVRLKACHICHGRWIGHQSLLLLLDHMRYSGLLGPLKRLLARSPNRSAQSFRLRA